jgi:hypothetical protein
MSFILNRFKTFEFYRNDLLNVLDLWDRTKGITRNPPTPTNQLEEDHLSNALAGGAGAKKQAQKKDKSNFQKNILINLNLIFFQTKKLMSKIKKKSKEPMTAVQQVHLINNNNFQVPHQQILYKNKHFIF